MNIKRKPSKLGILKLLFTFIFSKIKTYWGFIFRKDINLDKLIQIQTDRRSIVSDKAMVATSQPLAVEAGLEILRSGGNAADAAVAVAAMLNLTEPTSTGVGGDCFVLYYDAASKTVSALNGSGRSPEALTLEKAKLKSKKGKLETFHPYTVTVPGAVAGWCDLIEKHGRKSMANNLAPAIALAENGFPVEKITAHFWSLGVKRQLNNALNGHELTINGSAPFAGEIFRNPGLARTFTKIAEGGKEAFYQGEIGKAIIDVLKEGGGLMHTSDLSKHKSIWENPIYSTYKGYKVWECPPNGQGLATLLALNILKNFDLSGLSPQSPERLHLEIEAMRIAFADTRYFVADPEGNPAPLAELLSQRYAQKRGKLINRNLATLDQKHGTPTSSTDTAYLTVVDNDGNACSFINSNYWGFGTGIVPKGWGFTLQNRGEAFDLEEGHPNVLAPGKRPYHTIIPGMITHEDTNDLYSSFGIMGGFMQPQGQLQLLLGLIEDKLSPQTVLNTPRFCILNGEAGGKVQLERGIPIKTMSTLMNMGHDVVPVGGIKRSTFGRGQIIVRDRRTGGLLGGSDLRADGYAKGLDN